MEMLLIFMGLVANIVLCILIANAAKNRKGKSWGGYFALSLFLSPIVGLVAYALAEESRKKESIPQRGWNCPKCSKSNLKTALRCVKCGYKFGGY